LYSGGGTYNITNTTTAGIISAGTGNEFIVNVSSGGT